MSGQPTYHRGIAVNDTIGHTDQDVAVAGTDEQCEDQICYAALFQGKTDNSGNVYLGGENVPNADSGGHALTPGAAVEIWLTNLNKIWVNADNNGDGVNIIFWKEKP